MAVMIDLERAEAFLEKEGFGRKKTEAAQLCKDLFEREDIHGTLGWRSADTSAIQLDSIIKKAKEVRENAEVFVIAGVGGSNQAARAMIEGLTDRKGPEILYMGNTLSPYSISHMLKRLEGKSVYLNVIAKNFETLEPGSHFRVLRHWMRKRYRKEEMAERFILTGTRGSRLERIAEENGHLFLQFPQNIGGRYSAFTPVCLFPAAVAGLDLASYLTGMKRAAMDCRSHWDTNPAALYGAARNYLYEKGYDIEVLAAFEPQYAWFAKWWIQLFGESEGKNKKGIFPASAIYSEDLHSMGQYLQDGRRNIIETFLSVKEPKASVLIPSDPAYGDQFDYLELMDFAQINREAEKATMDAHSFGGVPCIRFEVEEISEETFGALYFYFMTACAISGQLSGVNPFDQEGVEEYKRSMFRALGK